MPNKEGIISNITPLSDLLKMDGAIDGELFTKVGEFQKKRRVGNDASGWIQVAGADESDTLRKMQYIFDNFEIEVKDEYKEKKYVKKI